MPVAKVAWDVGFWLIDTSWFLVEGRTLTTILQCPISSALNLSSTLYPTFHFPYWITAQDLSCHVNHKLLEYMADPFPFYLPLCLNQSVGDGLCPPDGVCVPRWKHFPFNFSLFFFFLVCWCIFIFLYLLINKSSFLCASGMLPWQAQWPSSSPSSGPGCPSSHIPGGWGNHQTASQVVAGT